MADEDEDHDRPRNTPDDDELARMLARLTDEQRLRHQTHVQNNIDRSGEVSQDYQLRLANTFLKNLPAREEAIEIGKHNRVEEQRARLHETQRDVHGGPEQTSGPGRDQPAAARKEPEGHNAAQLKLDAALDGKSPSGPPRDYSGLERAHRQIDDRAKQGEIRPASAEPVAGKVEPQTAILSKEQLVTMIEHFPDIRREANLLVSQSEIRERGELTRAHEAGRRQLEQANAAKSTPQQDQERDLLAYQHLAEQAGVQARGIAKALNAQGSPDAGRYQNDSRNAFHTARAVHQQRQHSGAGLDRSEETARFVEADKQQKQAEAQEAARGGKDLTSEQRANASPEAKQTLDRKERNDAAREVGMRSTDQSAQQQAGPSRPSKSGGRSR